MSFKQPATILESVCGRVIAEHPVPHELIAMVKMMRADNSPVFKPAFVLPSLIRGTSGDEQLFGLLSFLQGALGLKRTIQNGECWQIDLPQDLDVTEVEVYRLGEADQSGNRETLETIIVKL